MKNNTSLILILFLALFLSSSLVAQVPQGIPYQAMIRGNDGAALENANVTVRFTLHQNTTTGPVEYQETQALTTNAYGLINTQFGTGTPTQGTFSGIVWSNTSKFIQVEANDGNGYVDMGTQQMMSVPYAMYAGSAGNSSLPQGNEPGTMLVWNGSNWETIAPPTSSHATLNWCDGEIVWGDCPAVFLGWQMIFGNNPRIRANLSFIPPLYSGFGIIRSNTVDFTSYQNCTMDEWSLSSNQNGAYMQSYFCGDIGNNYYKAFHVNTSNDTSWSSIFTYFMSEIQCRDSQACNYDSLSVANSNCLYDNNMDGICSDSLIIECSDPTACNYSSLAYSNEFCIYDWDNDGICIGDFCEDQNACNYSDNDALNCIYFGENCDDLNNATFPDILGTDCNCYGTTHGNGTTDIDGNFYPSIIIGEQEWLSKNLAVSKYNNGDDIQFITETPVWSSSNIGSYSIYENLIENDSIYGKLYNWYSIEDVRGICPIGWHVPSLSEWTQLINFIEPNAQGGQSEYNNVGGALKNQYIFGYGGYWQMPNVGAANNFGFNALPAGIRNEFGEFWSINVSTAYWTSTSQNDNAILLNLQSGLSAINQYSTPKKYGYSVRCLKN